MNIKPHIPIGRIFSTPLIWRGWISLPFNQLAFWLYLTWQSERRRPERGLAQNMGVGLLKMAAFLTWEWLHNLAHAATAQWIGKPMDRLDIVAGMPICIYSPDNHRSTTPRQHIYRALGGPLFNLAAMLITRLLRSFTHPSSITREVLDVAVGMNTFLATASLLPIPGIDGGPILKWTLVKRGRTPEQADNLVRTVNIGLTAPLAVLSMAYFHRQSWLSGGLAAAFTALTLAIGIGWLKEEG